LHTLFRRTNLEGRKQKMLLNFFCIVGRSKMPKEAEEAGDNKN